MLSAPVEAQRTPHAGLESAMKRSEVPPQGFIHEFDFITEAEEQELVSNLEELEFSELQMQGVTAKRRVLHFGWLYGYESWQLEPGPAIPEFLMPLRERAAVFGGMDQAKLVEALVTKYPPGAGIGWHRDAPTFGPVVVGISLLGSCRFRLRRGQDAQREMFSLALEPRSAYLLSGPARYEWQHSIPAVEVLRYSVTFRTLRRRQSSRSPARSRGLGQ
jgi:alkylated DNA repair protein (DNA oxidative demethylase)